MLRRLGPQSDGGAGLAEYAGLIVLAALILGALVAIGIPSQVEAGVSSAICRIFQDENCGKPEASGKNRGGQNPGGRNPGDQRTGGPNTGNQNPDGQNPNGDEPSLVDLQKNADKAQKAADDASNKYGNIKQEIIDLLKDFIGITDIEDCISKGSISSCLWAAFDVASWVFAALKIAKFAKAVKDAIKLYKVFNKGRKIIDRAKDAAKRAKELLRRKRLACGLPAAYTYPNAPPGRVVHASFPMVRLAPAAPPACKSAKEIADELAKAKKSGKAGLKAHEGLGGHTVRDHVGKSKRQLLDRLKAEPTTPFASSFSSYKTADTAVGKALKLKDADIKAWLASGAKGKQFKDVPVGGKVGTVVDRNGTARVAKKVTVVLKKDPNSPTGYQIFTSFPTP